VVFLVVMAVMVKRDRVSIRIDEIFRIVAVASWSEQRKFSEFGEFRDQWRIIVIAVRIVQQFQQQVVIVHVQHNEWVSPGRVLRVRVRNILG